ncbi:MAG TPA: S9 family peptidase, partial [Flavobacteriales bacterium]|nr:S9 family peptidase [Flavobacteriales bacterium]
MLFLWFHSLILTPESDLTKIENLHLAKIKKMKHLLFIISAFMITQTQAQDKTELPGNTDLPSTELELKTLAELEKGLFKYSVEDYFKKPEQSSFQFSPDGNYFSFRQRDENGKSHVYVKNTDTDKINLAVEEGEDLIRGYGWANNSRLIYLKDKGGDENYHIYAADIDGKNSMDLTPFDGVKANFSNSLKDQKDFVIVDLNKNNPEIFEPYKLNIVTGELTQLYKNEDASNPISGYTFDKDGNLKGYTQQEGATNYSLYYRLGEKEPFKKMLTTTWQDNFYIAGFDYASGNPHQAYVISNLESNTDELILYDFETNKEVKKVFSNPTFDVGGMSRSKLRNYEIDYYYFNGEKSTTIPVSDAYKKMHEKFQNQFGDKEFNISSVTDKEDKYLIYVTSDKLYGKYFTYDVNEDAFKEIMDLMPQLEEDNMAEMRSLKFKTRDGLTI